MTAVTHEGELDALRRDLRLARCALAQRAADVESLRAVLASYEADLRALRAERDDLRTRLASRSHENEVERPDGYQPPSRSDRNT